MSQGRWAAAALSVVLLVLSACGGGGAGTEDGRLLVVATTGVLGDVAAEIAGDDGRVEVLIPTGADPHEFQVSSQQLAQLVEADLVVVNGLGLEEGLLDVVRAAAEDGAHILEVAELLDPLPFSGDGNAADEGPDPLEDPHVWLDPLRMAQAVEIIAAALTDIDATVDWNGAAERYAAELTATDAQIQEILSVVPGESRLLVTGHDSLGYFAARYDFEIAGVVAPGGSTLADPSSAALAALVEVVELRGVRAVFTESFEPAGLAESVASEAEGDVAVIELYTGSLGEAGSGADTLIGMLLTNARRVAAALS